VTDPALTDGAYRIRATLPSDRTGRHVLYTVWQNSSTPDTYYSCSDVVFPETEKEQPEEREPGQKKEEPGRKEPVRKTEPEKEEPSASTAVHDSPGPQPRGGDETPLASTSGPGSGPSAPMLAGGAAAVLLLTGGAALAVRLRRR
jgi:chitin-binding protein